MGLPDQIPASGVGAISYGASIEKDHIGRLTKFNHLIASVNKALGYGARFGKIQPTTQGMKGHFFEVFRSRLHSRRNLTKGPVNV
jgi:hypothetical protein